MRITAKQRYLSKINIPRKIVKRGGKLYRVWDYSKCWPWKAGKNSTEGGYGGFWLNGRNHTAQRAGWMLLRDEKLKPGHMVCHTCDHPWCQNPTHWFQGTAADNNDDKVKKGRAGTPFSEGHWNTKLSAEDVEKIKSEYTGKRGEQAALARRYGVHRSTISGILVGRERRRN